MSTTNDDKVTSSEVTSPDVKEPKPEAENRFLHSWRLAIVISSLFLGQLLMALDVNIINVAIPNISTRFHSLQDVAWYGSAYLLTITAFQPTFGKIYKLFDIDTTYRTCIIVFEVGSVFCAAASSSEMFIVGRAIAGLAAAGVLQGALAVIGQVVELEKRPLYMGVVVSVFAVTICIGPVLGGAFTQKASWRWCFWINLPIGGVVLGLLWGFLRVPGKRNANRKLPLSKKLKQLDPLACLIFLGAITCLLLALQWGGQTKPWSSATVIGLLIGFTLLLALFFTIQWKTGDEALIPFRVLFKRSIWTSAGTLFFLGANSALTSFYIPFYFQVVQGTSPIAAGVRFIPLMLPMILAVVITGALVSQFGHYVPYMVLGEIICIVGLALLTTLSPTTSTAKWVIFLILAGLGLGMAMQLPYTAVQITLKEDDIPTGNAIAVFSFQLGGAIAIAMGQTIVLSTLVDRVPEAIPSLSGRVVIAAGAVNISDVANTPEALQILRSIWNMAIVHTMYLAVALTAASLPFTLWMEWLNATKVASARKDSSNKTQLAKDTEK